MPEPKKDDFQRPDEWVDQDPYNVRGKPTHKAAEELLAEDVELQAPETREEGTFTSEQTRLLEEEGYQIYTLTGESIATLKAKGFKFWSTWHEQNPQFETLQSRVGQVAIKTDPDEFFIPDSNNKTLDKQLEMVEEQNKALSQRISGVKAILGEAADYIELAFQNNELFGEKYDYNYTRTQTPTVGSHVATVGDFNPDNGLSVNYWHRAHGHDFVWASPLVVPTSGTK